MKNTYYLLITIATMLACFTTANADVTYISSTSEPVSTQTQDTPAVQVSTTTETVTSSEQVHTDAPTIATPETDTSTESTVTTIQNNPPVVTPTPTTTQVVTPAPVTTQNTIPVYTYTTQLVSQDVPPANQIDAIRETVRPKHSIHFGIIGQIGSTSYYGDSDTEDMSNGLEWNAGLFGAFPLTEHVLMSEIGVKFLYRNLSNTESKDKNEFSTGSLAFPFLIDIFIPRTEFYFVVGTQIETPLFNNLTISYDGETVFDEDIAGDLSADISWDIVMGVGCNPTKHFGITANLVIGVTDLYNDLYVNKHYWKYTSFDINLGIKIFM